MSESITVEIKNWERFNGRRDVKQSSWLRLEHSISEDADFYGFSAEEFRAWIYILCQASKKSSARVTLHFAHANRASMVPKRALESAIKKLESMGALLVHVTNANADGTAAFCTRRDVRTRRDETRRNETPHFDFDAFWNLYPRKIAKSDARDRFDRLILTERDHADLIEAVTRFRAHHEGKGTEAKYIPHPATFLGTKEIPRWRDWLDPANGTSDIVPAGEFVGLKMPEARP